MYILIVGVGGVLDVWVTGILMGMGMPAWIAKSTASAVGLIFNFLGRRYLVFPETPLKPWKAQIEPVKNPADASDAHLDR
jgi:dolichol-phosphate mannosyltransferase